MLARKMIKFHLLLCCCIALSQTFEGNLKMSSIGEETSTTQSRRVVVDVNIDEQPSPGAIGRFNCRCKLAKKCNKSALLSPINCYHCISILSLAVRLSILSTIATAPSALAIQVSSRNILIKQASENNLFKCGQVPVYQKIHGVSIEPDLRLKALAYSQAAGTNNTSSSSNSSSAQATTSDLNNGNFRILHGLDATFGEWPWIVKIDVCKPNEECEGCTGSLLNHRWVVTAGHCVKSEDKGVTYKATLAQYDLIVPDSSTVEVPIDKVIRHPAYQELTNDLSLMRLARPVEFNEFIQPICLLDPTRDLLAYTSSLTCLNIGYGLIENMMRAVRLQKIIIRPLAPNECNSDKLDDVQLRTGTICIGPPEGQIGGSCHGDSGGPDVCYDPVQDQWILIGTVSYGPNDCDREKGSHWLTVSVDLSNYRTWIIRTLQNGQD